MPGWSLLSDSPETAGSNKAESLLKIIKNKLGSGAQGSRVVKHEKILFSISLVAFPWTNDIKSEDRDYFCILVEVKNIIEESANAIN